jgi:hypothetical protein
VGLLEKLECTCRSALNVFMVHTVSHENYSMMNGM